MTGWAENSGRASLADAVVTCKERRMKKQIFSLASFSAVVGAFAVAGGCSSTTILVTGEGGTTDAATKTTHTNPPPPSTTGGKTPPPPPAGGDGGGDDGGTTGGGTCPNTTPITTADLDGQFGWKAPHPIQNVCSGADISTLSNAFNNPANKTYSDIVTDISGKIANAACLGCIVTDKTATQWGPIFKDPSGALPNFGACYAAFPGSNAACGKANEYLELCVLIACNDCTDSNSFNACAASKGLQTACADPISAYKTACSGVPGFGMAGSAIEKACGDLVDGASTLCQGGIYDGGTAM